MTYLNKQELIDLDKKIDERIPQFPLLSRNRDIALFHLLFHFGLWVDTLGKEQNLDKRRNGYRNIYNALNHSILWIHKYCSKTNHHNDLLLDSVVMDETNYIFDNAMDYDNLWIQMTLLFRKRNQCKIIKTDFYEISSTAFKNQELETARMIIAHADDPTNHSDTLDISPQNWNYIKNSLSIKRKGKNDVCYSVKPNVFSNLLTIIKQRSLLKWSMDPDWDLGGYTYKELKNFWNTLQSLCITHSIAMSLQTNAKKHLNSQIRIMSKEEWVNEISKFSTLKSQIIKLILNDLIYDPMLYDQSGKQSPHVVFQPFFKLENGNLCVSDKIIRIANIERNTWNLLSIIRPTIHDILKNKKEFFWIQQFQNTIEKRGLSCFPNIKFNFEGVPGNIDLLIVDKELKFGLACELKWLTSSDTPKGVKRDDEQIAKGIDQAKRATAWIKLNTKTLSQQISLPVEVLSMYEFKPLVISKDNLPSGYLGKTLVPVINQKLFEWVMMEPHNKNLISLWNVAESMSYLPKSEIHFVNLSPIINWGEMKFKLKDVAFKAIKRWNPKTDISFD